MIDSEALGRICQHIECERIALREFSSDLPAVIAWMDSGYPLKDVDLSGNHFKSICGRICKDFA